MSKCPFFMQKTGGIQYGFKCSAYHNGLFTLYSHGERLQYGYGRGEGGAEYDKEGRDKYVETRCKGNPELCGLYQARMTRQ